MKRRPDGSDSADLIERVELKLQKLNTDDKMSLVDVLEKMKITRINEIEGYRFLEWTQDGRGIQLVKTVVIPDPDQRITFGERDSEALFVYCVTKEWSLEMNLTEVEVGSAVQYKDKEWHLRTSENAQENVVPAD